MKIQREDKRVKRLLFILVLTCVPSLLVHAAAPSSNVYEVEVVVFENRLPDLEGSEIWAPEQPQAASTEATEAVNVGEIPPADSSLAAVVTALEKSGRHPVLAHLRWQQSAEAKSVSKPVNIVSADNRLKGTLRFYLSRFLLVDVNLDLSETGSAGTGEASTNAVPVFHLTEARRVRLLETYYFDHPKLGAVVRVSPIKAN
jgi:hypothetical protein